MNFILNGAIMKVRLIRQKNKITKETFWQAISEHEEVIGTGGTMESAVGDLVLQYRMPVKDIHSPDTRNHSEYNLNLEIK